MTLHQNSTAVYQNCECILDFSERQPQTKLTESQVKSDSLFTIHITLFEEDSENNDVEGTGRAEIIGKEELSAGGEACKTTA